MAFSSSLAPPSSAWPFSTTTPSPEMVVDGLSSSSGLPPSSCCAAAEEGSVNPSCELVPAFIASKNISPHFFQLPGHVYSRQGHLSHPGPIAHSPGPLNQPGFGSGLAPAPLGNFNLQTGPLPVGLAPTVVGSPHMQTGSHPPGPTSAMGQTCPGPPLSAIGSATSPINLIGAQSYSVHGPCLSRFHLGLPNLCDCLGPIFGLSLSSKHPPSYQK